MLTAFIWGLIATSSLIAGGILASVISLKKRTIGIILGFGAGTLISAISYELVFESVRMAKGSGYPSFGFFAGAAVFFIADFVLEKLGKKSSNGIESQGKSTLVVPMVLAIILDGIPESIVLGLGLVENGSVSLALLVAIFISNLPESIAGSTGMKENGWSGKKIIVLWTSIAFFCALATISGFSLFSGLSTNWIAFIQSFAGGAILIMITNSMIPEAYEHGGKMAGVSTVLGFFISVSIVVLENS